MHDHHETTEAPEPNAMYYGHEHLQLQGDVPELSALAN